MIRTARADLPQIQPGCVCRPRRRRTAASSSDQFWYGDAAIMYDEFRTDNRFNLDMSIRRTFDLTSGVQLEFGADAMNILNHTQFSGAYWRSRGDGYDPEPGARPGAGDGQLEQLRDTGDGDVQPAADSAEDLTEVLKRDVGMLCWRVPETIS